MRRTWSYDIPSALVSIPSAPELVQSLPAPVALPVLSAAMSALYVALSVLSAAVNKIVMRQLPHIGRAGCVSEARTMEGGNINRRGKKARKTVPKALDGQPNIIYIKDIPIYAILRCYLSTRTLHMHPQPLRQNQ